MTPSSDYSVRKQFKHYPAHMLGAGGKQRFSRKYRSRKQEYNEPAFTETESVTHKISVKQVVITAFKRNAKTVGDKSKMKNFSHAFLCSF